MSALAGWLRSAVRTIKPGRRPAPARTNRVRLALEALETREVPTVAFTPQFSGTAVTPPAGDTLANEMSYSLKSPDVVVIFSGSDWGTNLGFMNWQTTEKAIKSILGSQYLSDLTQYGSDGKATFFSSWSTASVPTLSGGNTPNASDLSTFVDNQIATVRQEGAFFASLVPPARATTLYFVITDPKDSSSSAGTFGFNCGGGKSATHVAFVGAKGFSGGNFDGFTFTFAHELAESMANSIHVNDPGKLNLGFQICDGEPETLGGGYSYRINGGLLVQAYWSQADGAWVVPDGNSQLVTLSLTSATSNKFDLTVYGNQSGAIDTLDYDPVTSGQRLTLNNQVFSFEFAQLSSIHLYTAGGANTVNIKGVFSHEPVYVDSVCSTSNDTVVVGHNGSLTGIYSPVNVANSSGGKTALQVQAWADPPTNINITGNSVSLMTSGNMVNINYTPSTSPSLAYGVTSVTISDAYGANQIDAQSVPAYVPVTVVGNYFDNLFGPAASQVILKRVPYGFGPGTTAGGGTTTSAPATP
jgi:hypothetical protein